MACDIKKKLPLRVAQVLESQDWAGGAVLQLTDTVTTPRAEDLVLNFHFILPVVMKFRDRVPSQFFLADTFLYLHKLFHNRLLVPQYDNETSLTVAIDEAKKLKLCIGALRTLWRNSVLTEFMSKETTKCFVLGGLGSGPGLLPVQLWGIGLRFD
eukprot:Skav215654  [mRNA]  locus=scaffold1588:268256:268720:- [translate_table: standard]